MDDLMRYSRALADVKSVAPTLTEVIPGRQWAAVRMCRGPMIEPEHAHLSPSMKSAAAQRYAAV